MLDELANEIGRIIPDDNYVIYISSKEDNVGRKRILSKNVVGLPKTHCQIRLGRVKICAHRSALLLQVKISIKNKIIVC